MPSIPQRTTTSIELPGVPGGEVLMYDTLTCADLIEFEGEGLTETQKMLKVLPKLIVSWNLTNDKGESLPISTETISVLPLDAVNAIFAHIEHIAQKKEHSTENTSPSV